MSPTHSSETTPASKQVLDKYKAAAQLANKALAFAIDRLAPGASILEICQATDAFIEKEAAKVDPQGGRVAGGLAFPCCISVNNVLAYFSPIDDAGDVKLREGDLAKVELGAHVGGFPALLATSQVVSASEAKPACQEASNLIHAAHLLSQAASRLVKAGGSSRIIQEQLQKMCAELGVNFVEGMISHAVGQHRLADEKMIIIRPSADQNLLVKDECILFPHDVFVVDIAISTGPGTVNYRDEVRPTIYKRTGEAHGLRLKTSRAVLQDVKSHFGMMAFNLRELGGVKSRMGLQECCQHRVITAYEVLHEVDKNAITARVMFTTVLLPEGPLKLTDHRYPASSIKPTCSLQSEDLKKLIS